MGGLVSEGGATYPVSKLSKYNDTNYNVYGQSIFTSENAMIYGCAIKKTRTDCGRIWKAHICSSNADHAPQMRHITCNEPTCPVCYPKFSYRLADGICERLKGYQEVYPGDPISHLVMSPPQGTRYKDMKTAFISVTKMFIKVGGKGAAVWYHPYRMRKEVVVKLREYRDIWMRENPDGKPKGFWIWAHEDVLKLGYLGMYVKYSPHFHLLSTGYLIKSDEFYEKTGWIYKKVIRDEGENLGNSVVMLSDKQIKRVAHYISTHCAWEWTKHSVRYIGVMSYGNLGRTKIKTEYQPIICEICGHAVHEHAVSELTGEICEVIRTDLRRRVISWQYWKRVRKSRVKKAG
jgi:hypothetical protein